MYRELKAELKTLKVPQAVGTLRILRPVEIKSLELRVGTSFRHSYPRHWHDEFFISAITAGAGHFSYGGKDHIATPGTLVLLSPGEVHTHHDCSSGRSFRSLHLTPSFMTYVESELLQRPGSLANFQSTLISDPGTAELFLKLHTSLERSVTRLHHETLILSFFTRLSRHLNRQPCKVGVASRERVAVRSAVQFLHDHYEQAISLRDLAAHCNLSPYYFHRMFSRATGMPPHAYQIQLRIMRAKSLLKQWPIASVSALTGFFDQSHFTRQFKHLVGVTPAQYAGQGKKVQDAMVPPH
jgi:AraC-like DNA-binding protein/quercetin dioxygenase-like cupin family protein